MEALKQNKDQSTRNEDNCNGESKRRKYSLTKLAEELKK